MYNAGDFQGTETIMIPINTFSSDVPSVSVTVTDFAATDVHIHKDGSLTQRASASGITIAIDVDGIVGCHWVIIDLSDNTDPGFYSAGSQYMIRVEGITVDAGTLNPWIGGFTIGKTMAAVIAATAETLGNLTSGTAAINTTAIAEPNGFVIITGTAEANDEDSTYEENGITHDLEDDAGTTDAYYIFDVGGNGVPVSITWRGFAQAQGATYRAYAYNWVTSMWQQIGAIAGTVGATLKLEMFSLTIAQVGTGVNLGRVHFRYESTDGVRIGTDRLLCSYAIIARSVGYADGRIWIDTAYGTAGIEAYVNGVADKPVNSLVDLLTLAAVMGIRRGHVSQGSSLQFIAPMDNYDFDGTDYSIDLNGQQVDNTKISGATLSGACTKDGGKLLLFNCNIETVTLRSDVELHDTIIIGPLTIGDGGYVLTDQCASAIAGTEAPVIDCGGFATLELNMRHHSGGVHLHNLVAGAKVSIEGWGQIILNANCTGGTIVVRGSFTITDNAGGAVTVNDEARYDVGQITDAVPTADQNRVEMDSNSTKLIAIKAQTDNLPEGIPRNADFTLSFDMVDETDYRTLKPGLTIIGTRSIDKGNFAPVSGSIAEIQNSGNYVLTGVAADSAGTEIVFRFAATGAATRTIVVRTSA